MMKTKAFCALSNLKYSKIKTNISLVERFLLITGGAFLLYNGASKDKKSIVEMCANGVLVLRGFYGYCPLYDAVDHLKSHKVFNINV